MKPEHLPKAEFSPDPEPVPPINPVDPPSVNRRYVTAERYAEPEPRSIRVVRVR